jgi:radical SAM superfamily enzyme YgiQ (UPF0313 family)
VHPGVCENLVTDHDPLIDVLKRVRREKGIKKVFVASGVRYDLAERSPEFVKELAKHHTGGQLSVAPEHVDDEVLDKMKKPGRRELRALRGHVRVRLARRPARTSTSSPTSSRGTRARRCTR